jgi:hypothetical protein
MSVRDIAKDRDGNHIILLQHGDARGCYVLFRSQGLMEMDVSRSAPQALSI